MKKCFSAVMLGWVLMQSATLLEGAIELHAERQNESDLKISYMDAKGKETAQYLVFEDLLQFPTQEMTLPLEMYDEPQACRILMLDVFLKALPGNPVYDTLVADCVDGYFSYYTQSFIDEYKPFFVLQINGKNPSDWKRTASGGWMGPYLILVSEKITPAFKTLVDGEHKLPWGVNHVRLVNYEMLFAPLFSGNFSKLSASAERGRFLYLENCASCHAWEDGSFGGTKSNRNVPVIASQATFNEKYFRDYLEDPQKFMPDSTMPAQTHYGEEEVSAVIDFLRAYFKK